MLFCLQSLFSVTEEALFKERKLQSKPFRPSTLVCPLEQRKMCHCWVQPAARAKREFFLISFFEGLVDYGILYSRDFHRFCSVTRSTTFYVRCLCYAPASYLIPTAGGDRRSVPIRDRWAICMAFWHFFGPTSPKFCEGISSVTYQMLCLLIQSTFPATKCVHSRSQAKWLPRKTNQYL